MQRLWWMASLACAPGSGDTDAHGRGHGFSVNNSSLFEPTTNAHPASDPDNTGGWVLRSDLSDEFSDGSLDSRKWFRAGNLSNRVVPPEGTTETDGSAANWVGRAPSVFDPSNVGFSGTNLALSIEWKPDSERFPTDESGAPFVDEECDCVYENYTVGGIISKANLRYGYAEIRSRAAPVTVSSAFWMIGNHFEIDVFEQIGRAGDGPDGSGAWGESLMPVSLHNWDIGGLDENGFSKYFELDWRTADDFHVYGVQWQPDKVIFYADGQEVGRISAEEAGAVWNVDYMHIWVDNETFYWEGVPAPDELPAAFLIDYVRVWQAP